MLPDHSIAYVIRYAHYIYTPQYNCFSHRFTLNVDMIYTQTLKSRVHFCGECQCRAEKKLFPSQIAINVSKLHTLAHRVSKTKGICPAAPLPC